MPHRLEPKGDVGHTRRVDARSEQITIALRALERAIVPPRPGDSLGTWRWSVRQRLGHLREALAAVDLGLAPRERSALMGRFATLAADVLERADVDAVRAELRRLLADVSHTTAAV